MLIINFTERDFAISDIGNPIWRKANSVVINKYWSGKTAPSSRHAAARLLWTEENLYVRFDSVQKEPLVVSDRPNVSKKTPGLWDRDVCEIFIAPDSNERSRYFEFEVAPTGEWVDLSIHQNEDGRDIDLDYDSAMQVATKIETNRIRSGIKIPWEAFSKMPEAEEIWRGNLFRIIGEGESRGFLSWKPTETKKPDFHVPKCFGKFRFVK